MFAVLLCHGRTDGRLAGWLDVATEDDDDDGAEDVEAQADCLSDCAQLSAAPDVLW